MLPFATDATVVFLVYIIVGFAIGPLIKVFLQDGSPAQITVTRVAAMVLAFFALLLIVGPPPFGDGGAWASLIGVALLSGLSAMGVHVGTGGNALPPITALLRRPKASKQQPAPSAVVEPVVRPNQPAVPVVSTVAPAKE